jgi:hypothetical protein
MNKNLPGLSPLWLISLALVLGTLITTLIPISVASNIKPSDWIGFAGSVVAGAMTLFAAILAWFAVQRQITAQEEAERRATQQLTEQQHERETCTRKESRSDRFDPDGPRRSSGDECQYLEALRAEPELGIGGIEYRI